MGWVSTPLAPLLGALDSFSDAVASAKLGWLLAALCLHLCGQVCRGVAWHGILRVPWPEVRRGRVCAWYVCGAGLSGVLTGRGGDAVRISLAKRDLAGSTWAGLAGTLVAEGTFEAASGLALTLTAVWFGVSKVSLPSPFLVAGIGLALAIAAVSTLRSARVRRAVTEVLRGASILRRPRRFLADVLPWQVAGRVLRIAAVGFFLAAFGLPTAAAVIAAAVVVGGSGNLIPFPGLGAATAGAALLLVLPVAAGHPLDAAAVTALAIAQPALMMLVGLVVSLALLSVLSGVRTPWALGRTLRSLAPRPAGVAP
jgi:uncharacterized membrane protein YbhN (UPF0104 family)